MQNLKNYNILEIRFYFESDFFSISFTFDEHIYKNIEALEVFLLKIYFFSDFQGVKEIPDGNPDLVVLLGDISYLDAKEIDQKYNCPKIGVYGNHDSKDAWKETSIHNIHCRKLRFQGLSIAGFGGCPKYNQKPNQYTEEECEAFMNKLGPVDLFIAHSNPVYDADLYETDDIHRGFWSFNDYVSDDNRCPRYFVHGHIHNPFTLEVDETTIISVFPFAELDIEIETGLDIDLDA